MLTIYTSRNDISQEIYDNAILKNDIFFNGIKDKIVVFDDNMKNIIYQIDKAQYISGTTIKTRFGEYLDLKYLSTGCKTALNVYINPDKLVYCIEAGDNALEVIIKMTQGNVLIPIVPSIISNFKIDVTLVINGIKQRFNNSNELMEAWING